jgi:hypothetical protein
MLAEQYRPPRKRGKHREIARIGGHRSAVLKAAVRSGV